METITVSASRGFTLPEMEFLIGAAIVLAVLGWMLLSGLRHLRNRH